MSRRVPLLGLLAMLATPTAEAAVVSTDAGGFVVKLEQAAAATPDKVWQALSSGVGQWWSDQHTYSGKASNMTIEPRAGGCFCERWQDGEIEHLRVAYVSRKDRQMILTGGLGPILWLGGHGTLITTVTADGPGTRVAWEYRVSGHNADGWDKVAPIVDKVLAEQLLRLAAHTVETPAAR